MTRHLRRRSILEGVDGDRQMRAQIEHIALATSDVERLSGFYRLLGASTSPPCTDPETGLRARCLDFGGLRLDLLERPHGSAAEDDRPSPLAHLGFVLESADAVDALTEAIAGSGHRVLEPPHRAGDLGRYESVVLDPDGNRVKLTV